MQREKIQSLLMDHAMGAADEDVAALVEAYAEKDADARKSLEELRRTVGIAQRAIVQRRKTLPPFPHAALERAVRRTNWTKRLVISGAMAACVAMGVWAGWLFGDGQRERVVLVRVEKPVMQAGAREGGAVEVASVRDFWSVRRLRETVKEPAKPAPRGIGWQDRMNFGRSSGEGL